MAEYSAGSASILITPSMKGFAKKLRTQLERIQAELGIDLDTDPSDFHKKVKAALEREEQESQVTVDVNADTTEAAAEIDKVASDKNSTINVDADTLKASEELDKVSASRDTTINVDTDAGSFRAQMLALTRPRRVHVRVVMSEIGKTAQAINMLDTGMRALVGRQVRVVALGSAIGGVGTAALGTIAPLSAMVAALNSAVGAVGVLPGMFGGLVASLGALGVGVKGVGAAFGAMGEQATSGGADTTSAVQSALKGVQDAENNIARAQRNTASAQRSLNQARKEAIKQLRDMNQQLQDAAMDEEDAAISVARAKQRLAEVNSDSSSTGLDRAEADLAYRRAVKNLEDTRQKNNELAVEVAEANKKGVEGAENVIQAKEQVTDAIQAEKDAQEQLAQAIQSVNDAGVSAGGGVDAFQQALSKLAPSAVAFVLAVQALGPAWQEVKLETQEALFKNLGAAITELAEVQLPVLRSGLSGVASEINNGLILNMRALSSEASANNMGILLSNTAAGLSEANKAAEPFTNAMMNLMAASSQYLPAIGVWVADLGNRFAEFTNTAIADGGFTRWVNDGLNALHAVGQALSTVGGIISGVFRAAATAGQAVISPFSIVLTQVDDFVNSVEGQNALVSFFTAMQDALVALSPILTSVAGILGTTVIPALSQFIQSAAPGLQAFVDGLGQALNAVAPNMGVLGESLGTVAVVAGDVVKVLGDFANIILNTIGPYLPVLITGIAGLSVISGIVNLVNMLRTAWTLLSVAFTASPIGMVIALVAALVAGIIYAYQNSETFREAVNAVGRALKDFFVAAVEKAKSIIDSLVNGVKAAASTINDWWQDIKDGFTNFISWSVGLNQKLLDFGKDFIKTIWDGMKSAWTSVGNWISTKLNPANWFSRDGETTGQADGGITAYADGGINFVGNKSQQNAGVYAGGSYVVMAEDETQGEAFIPFAKSKRARSTQILSATAQHFGYSLVDADGNTIGYDRAKVRPLPGAAMADGGITVDDLDKFAQGIEGAPYVWGGVKWGDCSGAMSAISRYAVGLNPWGGRFATMSEQSALKDMGFTIGRGKDGDLRIGWFNGGSYGGHTSGTLPNGVNVEMGGARGNGQYGGNAAGADHRQYTDHAYLPAAFFKPIEVPVLVTEPEVSGVLEIQSAQQLKEARESGLTNPDTYLSDMSMSTTGMSDTPTSWSGLLSDYAKTAVEGYTKDILDYFGIEDEIPAFIQAKQQFDKAVEVAGTGGNDSQFSQDVEKARAAAKNWIDTLPAGVGTMVLTGAQLLGFLPKDPGKLPGGDALIQGFATGGLVRGAGGATSDSIPAMLSNGEYVVRESAARNNLPLLNSLNNQPTMFNPATGNGVEVHYHIETNNVDEGMRLASLQSKQQVMSLMGV